VRWRNFKSACVLILTEALRLPSKKSLPKSKKRLAKAEPHGRDILRVEQTTANAKNTLAVR
jgi:hypothetical protein